MVDVPVNEQVPSIVVDVVTNGQVAFAYPFRADDVGDLRAQYRPASGAAVDLVGGVGFTATGIGTATGGVITLTGFTATIAGAKLAIYRDIAIKRTTDYSRDLFAADLNREQDTTYMILQQLKRDVDLSVRVEIGQTPPDSDTVLASAAAAIAAALLAQQAAAAASPTTLNYGSSPSADSSAAIAAMGAALGYVRFPAGSTLINSNITIDYPMYFQDAAYITVASGKTVSLTNTVNTPDQWIFRGAGAVVVPLPDTDSGEDIRILKAIWFGAFSQVPLDQAPAIQKALNALGNSREGVVLFGCGSYQIESGMTVYRGTKVRSLAGVRCTVFQVKNDGYPVFQTANTACYFENIQFENSPTSLTRAYPFIHLKHDFCVVDQIFHQSAFNAVIVDGPNCVVRNVEGVYGGADPGAGSAQILVRDTGVKVRDINCRYSTGFGPTSIVELAAHPTVPVSVTAFAIENIEFVWSSIGVLVNANSIAIARGHIKNVNGRGATGSSSQVIKFITTGSGEIFSVILDGVIIPSTATAGITFQQDSSLSMRRISVDNVQDAGSTGNFIEFIQTAGSINNIAIGACLKTARANDIVETIGVAGGVFAITCAMRGRRKAKTGAFTVPYSGIEDGVTYHLQSASVAITLPNNADASVPLKFDVSTSAGATLNAGSGTINGAATKTLVANLLYSVSMNRNTGNCQWFTQA